MSVTGFRSTAGPGSDPAGPALRDDPDRLAVIAAAAETSLRVVGAPGTGKTTTLVELAAARILDDGMAPEEILALTTTRGTATALRDRLAARIGRATPGPLARTVNSLAFEIVASAAAAAGAPAPRLITGGEQDSDVAALLEGEEAARLGWPEQLGAEVRALAGFRTELRELMMRATEHGVDPAALAALGRAHGHPEWVAAAGFMEQYLAAVAQARPGQLDSAELAQFAVRALDDGEAGETAQRLRMILVDDVQEASASALALLRAFAARGVRIVAFGDPDVATSTFRGAETELVARLPELLGIPRMRTIELGTVHRHGGILRDLVRATTDRIGTAGVVGHRTAVGAPDHDPDDERILLVRAPSPARRSARLARHLRELHLMHGVPFSRMAVVVRSGAQVPGIARALDLADVPTSASAAAVPLRDDRAARHLLTVVDIGSGRSPLTPEGAETLLLGPIGGLDRLALRRLRLALRTEELAAGGNRPAGELLVEALGHPGGLATIDHRVARRAEQVAALLAETARSAAAGASIEELLWTAWEKSGWGRRLSAQAEAEGIAAAEANRDLDGVVALFTAAKRFSERRPDTPAQVFLEATLDARVPEDTLSPRPAADAVLVTTPPGAVGIEVDVVVVAGLQEGAWPNLRPRGSLLHPEALVRAIAGEPDAVIDGRAQVLGDELRMFALAVSRARREVVLAAVENEDDAASVFFSLAPEGARVLDTSGAAPLSLRGLTGRLRRELTTALADSRPGRAARARRDAAASGLAELAAAGVPGADPDDWLGLMEPTTRAPLYADDEPVPVSPSKLEQFETSPVDWFVDSVAGEPAGTAMAVGTIVHWAMETAADPRFETVWAAILERWPELFFEAPWLAERQLALTRRMAVGLADYLSDAERAGVRAVGVEKRFELAVGRALLRGSVDRLERSPSGEIGIVDLKTGAPIRQADIAEHPQLGAYQLAYADGAFDEALEPFGEHRAGGAKLVFVREGVRGASYREAVQHPFGPDEVAAFRARVESAAEKMAAEHFAAELEVTGFSHLDVAERRMRRVREVTGD